MSADNFYGVYEHPKGYWNVLPNGCMSILTEDCQYLRDAHRLPTLRANTRNTRAEALELAHDMIKQESIVEYGVMELTWPGDPCGECLACKEENR